MENNTLTPEQALDLLYKVTGTIQLNRADHVIVEKALHTLMGLLPTKEEK